MILYVADGSLSLVRAMVVRRHELWCNPFSAEVGRKDSVARCPCVLGEWDMLAVGWLARSDGKRRQKKVPLGLALVRNGHTH